MAAVRAIFLCLIHTLVYAAPPQPRHHPLPSTSFSDEPSHLAGLSVQTTRAMFGTASSSASVSTTSSSLSSASAASPESPPLSLPSSCRLLYISGDQAGVGKSSVAITVLHLLQRRHGVTAADLGYIKPCTQCEDLQLIGKYCQQQGVQHVDIGPVVFYSGYTQQCIDGTVSSTDGACTACTVSSC